MKFNVSPMKSRLKIVLISLICLLTTTSYCQQDSSKILTKSQLDMTLGISPIHWVPAIGIYAGISLKDKVMFTIHSYMFTINLGIQNGLESKSKFSTQIISINRIFGKPNNKVRLILGGGLYIVSITDINGTESSNETRFIPNISIGTDIRISEKIKINLMIEEVVFVSVGLKYRLSDMNYTEKQKITLASVVQQ